MKRRRRQVLPKMLDSCDEELTFACRVSPRRRRGLAATTRDLRLGVASRVTKTASATFLPLVRMMEKRRRESSQAGVGIAMLSRREIRLQIRMERGSSTRFEKSVQQRMRTAKFRRQTDPSGSQDAIGLEQRLQPIVQLSQLIRAVPEQDDVGR